VSAARLVAALVGLLATAPAAGYVRSTGAGGVPLSWPVPVVPYHVSDARSFHTPTCAPGPSSDPALDAVQASFVAWRQDCANLDFVYAGRVDEIRIGLDGMGENLVVFRNGWCSANPVAIAHPCFGDPDVDCGGIFGCFEDAPGDRNIVALTTVIHDPETGRIHDADIEVNGWDGQGAGDPFVPPVGADYDHGWWFTCADPGGLQECKEYGEPGCFFLDLQNTLTHEVGHFLGLAHPCEGTSCTVQPQLRPYTMYPSTGPGEIEKRSLHPDDIDGVCAIYPADGGGCGCGSGGAPGAGALLLVAVAFRRRRRAGDQATRIPA